VITNVYVDGFNLYYGCLRGSPYKWLDLEVLCGHLLPTHEIKRIRYFTAKVAARADPQAPVRQEAYLRALETLPTISIHYGHFLTGPTRMALANPTTFGPKTVEVIKTEEKGSDVNLATYLLVDAFRKDADAYVVVSNDSDLKEPIRIVCHELNYTVGLVNPHPPVKRSRALENCRPTFFKQIRAGVLGVSQFPSDLTDTRGAFHKPVDW
jgi:NYN domain